MTTLLFSEEGPDIYRLADAYDPDIHGLDPVASGKKIPAIGSFIVDGESYRIVTAVDANTYKYTAVPPKIVQTMGDDGEIVSYGNDKYMLYYDDRVSPIKLIIDSSTVKDVKPEEPKKAKSKKQTKKVKK